MRTGIAVKKPVQIKFRIADKKEIIHTLEGDMMAMEGDYIVTGIKGEQYPCKPDIFEMTYDITGEENTPVETEEVERLQKELKLCELHAGDFAADCGRLQKENIDLKMSLELSNQRAELTEGIKQGATDNVNEIRRLQKENEKMQKVVDAAIRFIEFVFIVNINMDGNIELQADHHDVRTLMRYFHELQQALQDIKEKR